MIFKCILPHELEVSHAQRRANSSTDELRNDNSLYYNAGNVKDTLVQSSEVYLWNNTHQITTVLEVGKISQIHLHLVMTWDCS